MCRGPSRLSAKIVAQNPGGSVRPALSAAQGTARCVEGVAAIATSASIVMPASEILVRMFFRLLEAMRI
jgi:hypothetical protein